MIPRLLPHARFRPAEQFHHRRPVYPETDGPISQTRSARQAFIRDRRAGSSSWCWIVNGGIWPRRWVGRSCATIRVSPPVRTGSKNRDLLNPMVEQWLASMPSDDAAVAALEENRVACAPVLSVLDTMKHPYFKARNMVRKVRDPILGEVTIPGFPLKFSAYPDLPDIQAPFWASMAHRYSRKCWTTRTSELRS